MIRCFFCLYVVFYLLLQMFTCRNYGLTRYRRIEYPSLPAKRYSLSGVKDTVQWVSETGNSDTRCPVDVRKRTTFDPPPPTTKYSLFGDTAISHTEPDRRGISRSRSEERRGGNAGRG